MGFIMLLQAAKLNADGNETNGSFTQQLFNSIKTYYYYYYRAMSLHKDQSA